MSGWVPTQFGSAEQFTGYEGRQGQFYSHQYTEKGRSDVIEAVESFIRANTEGKVTKLALYLFTEDGPETDLYRHQSNERWVADAAQYIKKAERILAVLGA